MSLFPLRGAALAWTTVVSCGFAMFLFGYDQGVMSGLITSQAFKETIFKTQTPKSSTSGLVVAIFEIGAFVGAISVIFFGQRLGRKRTTALGQAVTITGATIQAASYGLGQMITARIITGVGVGILTATVPIWSAEIAPAKLRGRAGGVLTISAIFGLVTAYWVDYGAASYSSTFSFRFPLALQLLFCLIQLVTIPFLPESPRWLVARGEVSAAKESILSICDGTSFEDSPAAVVMLAEIQQAVEVENDNKPPWKEMFVIGGPLHYFRRILLSFGLQTMQQLSGINVLLYYSTVVFEEAVGMSTHLSLLMGGFSTIAFLAGTFVAIFLVEPVGRRRLMLYGYACSCLGMIITTIGTSKTTFTYGAVATFGLFFFNFNFGIGLQIPPWLYGVEITPLKLRYISGSITAASGWIWNYAVVQLTQPGIEGIGYKFFIVWAIFNFCFFWVVYFFYPETAGMSLEELDFIFMRPEDRPISTAVLTLQEGDTEIKEVAPKHLENV